MTIRISNKRLDAILLAGQKMSNICYNLSQRTSELTERDRVCMKECQEEWDAIYPRKRTLAISRGEGHGKG